MNWMAKSNAISFALVLVSALGACGLLGSDVIDLNLAEHFQKALVSLSVGQNRQAESQAMELAGNSQAPLPRAWIIVAAARQNQQQYASAVRAYRMFLATCSTGELREFVLDQIDACQAAMNTGPRRAASPTRKLRETDIKELSTVQEETAVESSAHFLVRSRNARLSKIVAAEAETALKRICRVILAGQEFPHAVDVYIWTDRKDYQAHAGQAPGWSGGNYSTSVKNGVVSRRIDLTQLDEQGRFSLSMLDRVLPHELCHMAILEYFGDTGCPLFLNEGLAMMAEYQVDNERVVLAGTALASNGKLRMEELLTRQRKDLRDPSLFYAESYSFTAFLHDRLTEQQFHDFLGHIKSGCTTIESVQRALYMPPDESFAAALAGAWEDQAIQQAQMIRSLQGRADLLPKR